MMAYNYKSDDSLMNYPLSDDEQKLIENWDRLPESIKQLNMRRRPDLFNLIAHMARDKAVADNHKDIHPDYKHLYPEGYRIKSKVCR